MTDYLNRRKFGKSLLGLPALLSLEKPLAPSVNGSTIHHTTPHHTAIVVPGLRKECKILQISDAHISIADESEKDFDQYGQRMHNAFKSVKHYQTGETGLTTDRFAELITYGMKENVDLLALSGDILNYPSPVSVKFVKSQLERSGLPHMYTAGNHDWHYEGMEGTADELRDYWCKKNLQSLYSGNIYTSSAMVGDINVVMIDNSTYQVNEEQLLFFRKERDKGYPIALIVHIPVYLPGMSMSCGHPDWGWESDRGFEIERRQRWPKTGNLPSTVEFVREVVSSPHVVGTFAGHWHRFHSASWKDFHQHLALPAFSGQSRMIHFIPERV
jgi:predicted MPP superfamily phosphohydrolase